MHIPYSFINIEILVHNFIVSFMMMVLVVRIVDAVISVLLLDKLLLLEICIFVESDVCISDVTVDFSVASGSKVVSFSGIGELMVLD